MWIAGSVAIVSLFLTAVSKPAEAATALNNGGFETGNLSGWSVSTAPGGGAGAVTSYGNYGAQEGSYFALLTPGQASVDTMISQPFSAVPGDRISGWAFFKAEDYIPYNDTGKVLIRSVDTGAVVATVFQSSVSSVGNYGGTPWTPWEHAFTESGTFVIEARVANQGDSSVASRIGLDDVKTHPTSNTFIDSGPSGTVGSDSANFAFSSNPEGSAYECSLDGGSYAGCTSPKDYAGLADGSHTFQVRAIDANGNISTPAKRTWIVDVTTPDTTIPTGPDGLTNDNTPTFSFGGSDNRTSDADLLYSYKVDAGEWSAYSGETSVTLGGDAGLDDGPHTFYVRAKDAVGNVDESPAERSFTVDTAGPDTTISSGPSGDAVSTSASFSFSSEEGASFQCKLDSESSFSSCTSPKGLANLSNGSHAFHVRAIDVVGNVGPVTSRTWNVDTTLPNATITSGPSGSVRSTSARFSFSSEGSSFRCSFDGGPYEECYSPKSYFGLHDGVHLLRVKATDVPGNNTPTEREWVVDTAAPDTAITSGPSGTVNGGTASFAFSFGEEDPAEEGSTFQCSLDGAPFGACASPKGYADLADGPHTFSVRAVDATGNKDSTPATRTWTVDTVLPTVSDIAPANASKTRDKTPTIRATVEDNLTDLQKADMELYVDGNLISLTRWSYSASTDALVYNSPRIGKGKKTVKIVATDAAGNVLTKSWYFTVR